MPMDTRKPFMILMASQKGGVGKTTLALNLAVALRINQNFRVLLVDEDTDSASISEQLGIKAEGSGYQDVISGKTDLKQAMFVYQPIDLYIIPANSSTEKFKPKLDDFIRFHSKLARLDYDFVIVDNMPGFFADEVARYFDDVAIVTTPDRISAQGSSKMSEHCERHKLEHRLIINRFGSSKFDLERAEVEKMYGDLAFQIVPEDKIVEESVSKRRPAYLIDRTSDFSLAMDEVAGAYALKRRSGSIQSEFERTTKPSFFEKLGKVFFGR